MVVRARASNVIQLAYLRNLQTDDRLDFWNEPRLVGVGQPVDIRVPASDYEQLARSLNSAGILHHVKVKDIELAIKEERQTIENRRKFTKDQKAFDFENYHTYEEVHILIILTYCSKLIITI